jgi:hypothetical protein
MIEYIVKFSDECQTVVFATDIVWVTKMATDISMDARVVSICER